MKKLFLSVAIATYNEEENIGRCLKSIQQLADEIVIVDGSSTDRTEEIAEKLGAKVIITTNKPMFHANKNLAINNCRGEWILQLDADEIVPIELSKEIIETISNQQLTINNNQPNAYWLKRRNYFLGRYLKKGGQYPDPVIRLFKKGKAKLPEKSVHEQMKVEGNVGWLKNDLLHWATPKFSRYWLRENRYSSLEAESLFRNRLNLLNPLNWLNYLIIKPLFTFLNIFVFHKGFVDSWQGFVFAFFSGFHFQWSFAKYLKMKIYGEDNLREEWK